MGRGSTAVSVARIHARQAIVVALLTSATSIFGTLVVAGVLFSRSDQTASGSESGAAASAPGAVPLLRFRSAPIDLSLADCIDRAAAAMASRSFESVDARTYAVMGSYDDHGGAIWCHTDVGQVIFMASGPDERRAENTLVLLESAF